MEDQQIESQPKKTKKARKVNDKRSETSKANIRKAQATKAQRQREFKEQVAEFKQKLAKKTYQRGPIVNDPAPVQAPAPAPRKTRPVVAPVEQYYQEPVEESDEEEEEIVIRSRPSAPRQTRTRQPTRRQVQERNLEAERYAMQVEFLQQQLAEAKRKPPRKPRQPSQPKPKPEPQVIQIVNPAPIPVKPSVAEEQIKRKMLCQF